MSTSNTRKNGGNRQQLRQDSPKGAEATPTGPPFIQAWCKMYGLDTATAAYLEKRNYEIPEDVLALDGVVDKRCASLDDVKQCLLRGAVSQYRLSRSSADKVLKQKGVVFTRKPKAKDPRSMWRNSSLQVTQMDSIVGSMMSPQQRDAVRELRKRLHNKRPAAPTGGISLHERILQRRTEEDKKEELTPEQMNEKVDDALDALTNLGLGSSEPDDPNAPEVDLEESRRQTDEAMYKLETDLFSEDEKVLVAKMKQLEQKYKYGDSAEFEQELEKLIQSMC